MSLLGFCEWLAATPGSIALHESLYMYPLLESAHVLTLCLFVGTTVMLDLRLLGLTLRAVPVSEVLARLMPYIVTGFAVMIVTGALLFYAIPVRTYQSIFFRAKLLLLLLAGLNVWRFNRKLQKTLPEWDTAPVTPRGARFAAAASIALWFGIIVAGRMIAYNWFDCDLQPQSALVNWAAGCVVAKP
jgi:hypothetical protein